MTAKLINIFLFCTICSNIYASSCESQWVENKHIKNENIYSEITKIFKLENLSIIATPKAIKVARNHESPSLMIHKLKTTNINAWKIIVSSKCDIDAIKKLDKFNRKTLKKFTLSRNKKLLLNFSATHIGAVVSSFSSICKIPVEISSNIKAPVRVWLASNTEVSCADFPTLFAAHGVKFVNKKGKLIAQKA